MTTAIKNLEPQALWSHFYEMTQISRPSKKEEKISAFTADFGKKLGLPTEVDSVGNVLIRKPASKGMEGRKTVILQGHMDMVMVPQSHTGAIDAYIDGDFVKARGTTLGADNGIGAAAAMVVLESKDIAHPPIEALFTIDEETGMSGVSALSAGWLKGDILINLDSEEDNELCIGCAGGLDALLSAEYPQQTGEGNAYELVISGLKSGHSGNDINLGRANAIKLAARVLNLLTQKYGIQLSALKSGEVRNAIPSKATAVIVFASNKEADIKNAIAQMLKDIQAEYELAEGGISIDLRSVGAQAKVMDIATQQRYINLLLVCPCNVIRMSNAIAGLVETSINLGLVDIGGGKFSGHCLLRSSVGSAITHLGETLSAACALAGVNCKFFGGYPGWKPNINSPILKVMSGIYERMFGEKADVRAVHAGLECGLLGSKYPNLDMISCGPNIMNPHSTAERVQISSVGKWWKFLLEVLKNIPAA
jgi:dipeptidase D